MLGRGLEGYCTTGLSLNVSFYQWWNCQQNGDYVAASGSSTTQQGGPAWCGISGQWESYPIGLSAFASAQVYGYSGYNLEGGWDEQECDGGESYSGPFSYDC